MNIAEYSSKRRTRSRGIENGSVVKSKDGKRWIGLYHVYTTEGKRIGRKITLGLVSREFTKTKAREKLRVFLRGLSQQPDALNEETTFAELAENFMKLNSGDWSKSWMQTTRSTLKRVLLPEFGHRRVVEITPEELKIFVNSLPQRTWRTSPRWIRDASGKRAIEPGREKGGLSVSYAKQIITRLRTIFELATEKRPPLNKALLESNPARNKTIKLTVPKQARKPDKSILPPQEMIPLLQALDARGSLLVRITLYGGLRGGELLAIKGADVCPGWVEVQRALDPVDRAQKETKTGVRHVAQLPPNLMRDLKAWIALKKIGPTDLVFQNQKGGACNRANLLKRLLRPAAKRAGIKTLEVDFQMLRRTFATLSPLAGIGVKSIQTQLGHTTPDMSLIEYQQHIDLLFAKQLETLESMVEGHTPMPVDAAAKLQSRLIQ